MYKNLKRRDSKAAVSIYVIYFYFSILPRQIEQDLETVDSFISFPTARRNNGLGSTGSRGRFDTTVFRTVFGLEEKQQSPEQSATVRVC
jgi:hypothetical protein